MINISNSCLLQAVLLAAFLFGVCNKVSAEGEVQLTQNEQIVPPVINTPASGTLLLPTDAAGKENTEKKCMTLCASWGEECSYINRGTAGTTRSCRRTCQQYTEECF